MAETPSFLPTRPDRMYKAQPFWLGGHVNHTTQDGRQIILDVWWSLCAECGEPFSFRQSASAVRFSPTRRCVEHRPRAGAKVSQGEDPDADG